MLKKLRIKLTIITMSLVTFVLLAVMATMMIGNYRKNVRTTENALSHALMAGLEGGEMRHAKPEQETLDAQGGDNVPPEFENSDETSQNGQAEEFGRPDRERNRDDGAFTPTMMVTVAASGEITVQYTHIGTISDENLQAVVEKALASDQTKGLISGYSLRYMKQQMEDGTWRIAFADRSHETQQLRSLFLTSLAVGIPALLVLFGVSLFLSNLALKPVKASLDQQKQFVADASHELKTPLTVILTNNEIMARHASDSVASQQEWLDSTREEGNRMKKLIDDLLFLAKSDADRMPITLTESNFSDLVFGCALTFEPVAFEKGILVDTDIQPDLMAMVDEGQMKQLVMILLDNACKYSAEKGTIRVALKKQQSDLVLSVNNMGAPIPEDDLPHLFERFYRADASRTSQKAGGHGLGLSIAKTIAELHKGSIAAASTAEDGTTFTVRIPAASEK